MEIAERTESANVAKRIRSSCFDCDATVIDSILGRRTLGDRKVRIDPAEPARCEGLLPPHKLNGAEHVFEINASLQRVRLLRLLDRQQEWYDAGLQAAKAAEQLLLLCEHHQQLWLQSPTHL